MNRMICSEQRILIYTNKLVIMIHSSHDITVQRSRVLAYQTGQESSTRPASRSKRESSWGLTIVRSVQSSYLCTSQRCWSALSNKHSNRHSKSHLLLSPHKHQRYSRQRHLKGVDKRQHLSLTLGRRVRVHHGQLSSLTFITRIK